MKEPWAGEQGAKRRGSWLKPSWEKQTPTLPVLCFQSPGGLRCLFKLWGELSELQNEGGLVGRTLGHSPKDGGVAPSWVSLGAERSWKLLGFFSPFTSTMISPSRAPIASSSPPHDKHP